MRDETFVECRAMKKQMETPFRAPEHAERLFDLISVPDSRLLPAFYFALRDTLVTSSLDLARSIAYRENRVLFRVVTMDGVLIDNSGTMSGGGTTQRRGLMRIGSERTMQRGGEETSEKAMKALETEVERLSRDFEGKSRERSQLRVEKKEANEE